MIRRLRALCGPLEGSAFVLRTRTVLGRGGEADVQILDLEVSRQHACVVEQDDGRMVLMDMSSTNGTFVGGERISYHTLAPGDEFTLGESTFAYEERVQEALASETDEAELKLLSGPSRVATVTIQRPDLGDAPTESALDLRATFRRACGDPVHEQAMERGWRYCPACGGRVDEEE